MATYTRRSHHKLTSPSKTNRMLSIPSTVALGRGNQTKPHLVVAITKQDVSTASLSLAARSPHFVVLQEETLVLNVCETEEEANEGKDGYESRRASTAKHSLARDVRAVPRPPTYPPAGCGNKTGWIGKEWLPNATFTRILDDSKQPWLRK